MDVELARAFSYLLILLGLLWLRKAFVDIGSGSSESSIPPQKRAKSDPHFHTCKHCQNITVKFPTDSSFGRLDFLVRLDHTVSEVSQAAADDCQLLRDACIAYNVPLANRLIYHYQVFLSIFAANAPLHAFTACRNVRERAQYFIYGLSNRPFHIRFGRLNSDAGGTSYARLLYSAWHSFELDLSADHDDHAAKYISERPLNYIVASESTFRQANQWLTECVGRQSSHPQCLLDQSAFVPTRLIEIRHHRDGFLAPRIVQSEIGKVVQWGCLSYCWGGDQPVKTTKAKLQARAILLPFEELSRTLRDALRVADRLGLRFMWIDALCIVQDDPYDVAREIAMMPDIYKYGVCTIAASRASNNEEGFLQDHEIEEFRGNPISLRVMCPDGKLGHVNLAYRGAEYRYSTEPIHRRAWCFQERILSTRILDFGHTQLRWTCLSKACVDGGKVDLATATDRLVGRSLQSLNRAQLDDLWLEIVEAYTRRSLTFIGDKLLAISAVASEFAGSFNDDYLAGLWRCSLSNQLAWRAGRARNPRSKLYIAPSWSWASAPEGVDWSATKDGVSAIYVIDCQVQLAHPHAPFGAVIDGFILLRGQMRQVVWYINRGEIETRIGPEPISFVDDRKALEATSGHGQTHFLGWVSADVLVEEWPQDSDFNIAAWCLKLRGRTEKNGTRCLILLPTDNTRASFRRIAFFEIGDARYRYDPPIERDFFEGALLDDIKIV